MAPNRIAKFNQRKSHPAGASTRLTSRSCARAGSAASNTKVIREPKGRRKRIIAGPLRVTERGFPEPRAQSGRQARASGARAPPARLRILQRAFFSTRPPLPRPAHALLSKVSRDLRAPLAAPLPALCKFPRALSSTLRYTRRVPAGLRLPLLRLPLAPPRSARSVPPWPSVTAPRTPSARKDTGARQLGVWAQLRETIRRSVGKYPLPIGCAAAALPLMV